MSQRPLEPHRAAFLDVVDSVRAHVDIGTEPLLGGSRGFVPTVRVTFRDEFATFQRPTFRQAFTAAEDWLEQAVARAERAAARQGGVA